MAKTETSAVAALARLKEEDAKMKRRIAEARRAAAAELGEVVLSAGAEAIAPRDLKTLLASVMKLGAARSLELLAGADASGSRPRANGASGSGQEAGDGRA